MKSYDSPTKRETATRQIQPTSYRVLNFTTAQQLIANKTLLHLRVFIHTAFAFIMINQILEYNRKFVAQKGYEEYLTDKYPNKRIAIVTCMDTRLTTLLPAALGIRNGDVKIIKNAGGTITNPFDSTVRSLLVAIYELGVTEVMIIGHTGCGVQGMDSTEMLHLMKERGIPEANINLMKHCGIDLESWLHGFDDTDAAILETVDLVKHHPLVPADVVVRGYVMDSVTGALRPLTPLE